MMNPRPFSILSFLHFERISLTDIPGVSSMMSVDSPSILALSTSSPHSLGFKEPVRMDCASIFEFMESKRLANCSLDISRLKNTVGIRSFTTTCSAILSARAVLPMEGRAASRSRSDFWKPAVL